MNSQSPARGAIWIILLSLALCGVVRAQIFTPPDKDWKTLREMQPKALHVTMALPKDHFFQGERIDAALCLSNDEPAKPYYVVTGVVPGGFFVATDSTGRTIPDPDAWYYDSQGCRIRGPLINHVLGAYQFTLPINASVRFDHSGTYSLYAVSPVSEGTVSLPSQDNKTVWIVSEKTNITIEPLTAEEEKRAIFEALCKLGTQDAWSDGIADLGYLGTPEAVDRLVSFLGNSWYANQAEWALINSPDPVTVAGRILEAVKSGNLTSGQIVDLYAALKSWRVILNAPRNPNAAGMTRIDSPAIRKAEADARKELLSQTGKGSD